MNYFWIILVIALIVIAYAIKIILSGDDKSQPLSNNQSAGDIAVEQEDVAVKVKKWPVLAQILIALGCIGGIRITISGGLIEFVIGIVILVVFWNVYKFKRWAVIGLTISLSLNILLTLLSITNGYPIQIAAIIIPLNGFVIFYFNSKKIKSLFIT